MVRNEHRVDPSADASACPTAEALSCFVDDELPNERTAQVRAHLEQCADCTQTVDAMQQLLGRGANDRSGARKDCPDRETLAAYAASGWASDAEWVATEAHVIVCAHCATALMTMRRHLLRFDAAAEGVPAHLEASTDLASQSAWQRSMALPRRVVGGQRKDIPRLLRLPVLVPVAFAAGVLCVIALRSTNLIAFTPTEQYRSAPVAGSTRRLAVADALMRVEPQPGAVVVGRLSRGMAVEIQAVNDDWYLVATRSGTHGWVPQQAFE